MLYNDFIRIDRQFESAVNLGLDLNQYKKLKEYIPTDASVSLLKEYLKNIEDNTQEKASVLIGPYGKGKSHLLLILAALVGMSLEKDENIQVLKELTDNIAKQDPEAAEIANRIIDNKKRLLPVIINGGYGDLQQTFLVALKEALEREGIHDITPDTYYDVAIKTINKWKVSYKETFQRFEGRLIEKKYTVERFIALLNNCDKKAYNLFCKLHIEVCSGSIFNPMINMDTVSIYKAVNEELMNHNYSGILVVFDEFSKFLDNTKLHTTGELKILQDFAEFTNRKGNEVYLICVTHKPIGNYAKDLPKERAMAYRTVEGRFKEIYFVSSAEQNYGLIKNSIQRDEKLFSNYMNDHKAFFEELKNRVANTGIFPEGNLLTDIVEGCFPLHPMTTFMSIRISELVAQNERTLFTFLASHQKYTLRSFIETNKKNNRMLTMDRLYDYFKDGIKKELSNENIASVYLQTENLLGQDLSRVQAKIIKCMALIHMINQPNVIQATEQVLKVAINEKDEVFEQEINELLRGHKIYRRKSDGVFICLNASTVNLESKIQECKQLKVRNLDRRAVLKEVIDLGYTLPKAFNDDYEMIRFFKNQMITFKELEVLENVEEYLLQQHCDGIIGYLVYDEEDDLSRVREKVAELADKRLLIYVPNQAFALDEQLKEYVAIGLLKEDKNLVENDSPILDELKLYEQDTLEYITHHLNNYFSIGNKDRRWVSLENSIDEVKTSKELSRVISNICREVYNCTPVIASELINKHNISGPIVTARNKIITSILEGNNLETKGNSPDITITRAVITNKFVMEEKVEDLGLKKALDEIEKFILSTDNGLRNFGELYDKLYKAPYGMRKGVISIYLAIYLKKFSNDIIIYNALKEEELDATTIKLIDKEPSNYNIRLEQGTKERIQYINDLATIFNVEISGATFYQQCRLIVDKMKNWFRALPKCSRELQGGKVEETCILELRKQITKFDINAREFLLEIVPNIICKQNSLAECTHIVEKAKKVCDENFGELINQLVKQVKTIFSPNYPGELSGALKTWYATLDDKVENYVLSTQTTQLLNIVKEMQSHDELYLISQIGHGITGLQIEDWNQDTSELFIQELYSILEEIKQSSEHNEEAGDEVQVSIKINGKTTQKLLRNEEVSAIGETLFTNLSDTLEEYGDAIDTTEKMNILVRLIEKLM